ncbi:MAG TPA: MoaD/ThiS family protein [Methylomirabilota bacterium]|nr:MoaD/ThiS family protein [Methylomirabilota bacterium]
MRVFIASPLHSYTGGRGEVEGRGATLGEVLADLDARYPGLRFRVIDEQDRVRPHMKLFVGGEPAESLAHPIPPGQEVHILQSLSGGQVLNYDMGAELPAFILLDFKT